MIKTLDGVEVEVLLTERNKITLTAEEMSVWFRLPGSEWQKCKFKNIILAVSHIKKTNSNDLNNLVEKS